MKALFLVHRWPSPHYVLTWLKEGYRVLWGLFYKGTIPLTSWQRDGETVETVADFIFWAPKSLQMVIAAMKLKDAYSLQGKL